MPFHILRSDITKIKADAIVNSANPKVFVGSGVDGAIHKAAGPRLLEARAQIGPLRPGQAAATPAFNLDAQYVIHTVGPDNRRPEGHEEEDLRACYRNSLQLARDLGCASIAFPLISTGAYRFPKTLAIEIAADAIREFLQAEDSTPAPRHGLEPEGEADESGDMEVFLVVYDMDSFVLSKNFSRARGESLFAGHLASHVEEYFAEEGAPVLDDDLTVHWESRIQGAMNVPDEEAWDRFESVSTRQPEILRYAEEQYMVREPTYKIMESREAPALWDDLDWMLDQSILQAQSFSQRLLALIDGSGKTDPQIYKAANLDRKLFSKIRSNPGYQPSKGTVLSLAIALQLNLDQTLDLLRCAGYALSPAIPMDVIVAHYIRNGSYDIVDLNFLLFARIQKTLV